MDAAVDAFAALEHGFSRGIRPGVHHIRSPRVPAPDAPDALRDRDRSHPHELLWVHPDCRLKTRGYAETVERLGRLVEAADRARAGVAVR